MRKLLYIIAAFSFLSCKNEITEAKKTDDLIDSLERSILVQKKVDSMIKKSTIDRISDTTGMKDCPIKILSAKFIKEEYSNYKKVKLVYKNISKKKIQAIRFEWYGINSFNEPADMTGSYEEGLGGGFTDEILNPGSTNSGIWNVLSVDGKKILYSRAYEVAFTDGTKWEVTK